MVSTNGEVVVTFNGEIYNYLEIWKELAAKGYRFQTDHSDTEAIVNGYLEWGYGIFTRLNGMFAISIYDKRKNVLLLARGPHRESRRSTTDSTNGIPFSGLPSRKH